MEQTRRVPPGSAWVWQDIRDGEAPARMWDPPRRLAPFNDPPGGPTLTSSDAPIAVDLFAGAGGLAEGLLSAGINIAASVELHPQPALTHAFNHPSTKVLVGDIRELDLAVLDSAIQASVGNARVDLVVGGPPCQGFSSAGRKVESDPRNSLFRHYIRVVEHLRPSMFLMENVPGFKSRYGGAVYSEAVGTMRSLGYETTDRVMEMKEYGVPQTRRRFVMVGWIPGEAKPFVWPEPTHTDRSHLTTLFAAMEPFVTASSAIDDLADLEPGLEATRYLRLPVSSFSQERRAASGLVFNHLATKHRAKAEDIIRRIPVGGSIRDIAENDRGTKKLTMSKLDPARISNTIVSLPDDLLHYAQGRILTVREMARLQTFDDDFVFFGKRTSGFVERRVDVPQYTQVGNAVPPHAGRALGASLVRSLGGTQKDLRDLEERNARHRLVVGSSGYSGYELAPAAAGLIELQTVVGDPLELPLADDLVPVTQQVPLRDWPRTNPTRGQWAPGVIAKKNPSWMGEEPAII